MFFSYAAGKTEIRANQRIKSVDDQRCDFVVRDGEVVIERDRASGKCSGYFDTNDGLVVALLRANRFELEVVFLKRRYQPAFDLDLAAMCFVLVAHNAILGEASENRLHIVRITGVDIALDARVKRDGHDSRKGSAISTIAQILGLMQPFSLFIAVLNLIPC